MIKAENLFVKYPDATIALRGINLEVSKGDCVAVLGSNGAGKSTLFKAFAGLAEISSGEAHIGSVRVEPKNLGKLRSLAGFVFQNPDDMLFSASVLEDVLFGLRNMKIPESEARQRAMESLKNLEIDSLANHAPFRLSDGEKKRAAICCVLAMRPEAIFFDEPTAQLDPRARREFISIAEKMPQTKIVATHDLNLAKILCQKSLVLHEGKVAAFGDTTEILSDNSLLLSCGLA